MLQSLSYVNTLSKKHNATAQLSNLRLSVFLIIITALLFSISGCENDPGDVGIIFVSPDDTSGVKYLDSQRDSIQMSSSSQKILINAYGSVNLLVGRYQDYECKTVIRFFNLPPDFDSSEVSSAIFYMRNNKYYYEDNSGVTAFEMFSMLEDKNFETITLDSLTSMSVSTTPIGSFSGVVKDSQLVEVPLDNQTIEDWFNYAADTAYPQKNYGMMIQPTNASSAIKGFFSFNNDVSVIPYITVIKTKNGITDTITMNVNVSLSLSNAPASVISPDRMLVQNGISFRSSLNFDLSKLPNNVIINNATIDFVMDQDQSYISENGSRTIVVGLINDTTNFGDTLFVNAFPSDSIRYSVSVNQIFQYWNSGVFPNLGVSLRGFFELQNIDKYSFYSPAVGDTTLRPRLRIYYTLRN